MSTVSQKQPFGNFGFRFQNMPQNHIANISSIGWELQISPDYYWDGLTRKDIHSIEKYVFQYTLSGQGAIVFQDNLYPLNPGEAFFVKLPSKHHYYLPEKSDHWEFIYITLTGSAAASCWSFIHDTTGKIMKILQEAPLIKLLKRI